MKKESNSIGFILAIKNLEKIFVKNKLFVANPGLTDKIYSRLRIMYKINLITG